MKFDLAGALVLTACIFLYLGYLAATFAHTGALNLGYLDVTFAIVLTFYVYFLYTNRGALLGQ